MKQSNKALEQFNHSTKSLMELIEILGELRDEAEESEDNELFFEDDFGEKIFLKSLHGKRESQYISIRGRDMTITIDFHDD